MAAGEKKQRRRVRFELGWGGIAGLVMAFAVICLWMFILGVWTGQSLLQSPASPQQSGLQTGKTLIAPLLGTGRERQRDGRQ